MFAVVQNGVVRQILQLDVPFSVGDKHYSSNFLRTSSSQEKIEAGVWEIIQGNRPDDRFFWVDGPNYRVVETSNTVEASYTGTPKDLEELKKTQVGQLKATANALLQPSDWMVLRQLSRGVGISHIYEDFRTAVIDECTRVETALNAASTVEELMAVETNWPVLEA